MGKAIEKPCAVIVDAPRRQVRLAAPKVCVVSMEEVPDPPAQRSNRDKYGKIWSMVCVLEAGMTLRVDFETAKQAHYVRAQLRKKAKAENKYLSHSRTADDLTMYFWLEKL